jgi:hypothetical protein
MAIEVAVKALREQVSSGTCHCHGFSKKALKEIERILSGKEDGG